MSIVISSSIDIDSSFILALIHPYENQHDLRQNAPVELMLTSPVYLHVPSIDVHLKMIVIAYLWCTEQIGS